MKKGFSLVELMIVVAVLGILAAIVVPQFQSQATQAKESAAKSNLRTLRGAIELYTTQHSGIPPGYPNNNPTESPSMDSFTTQMITNGRYLASIPENPFNNKKLMKVLANSESFPAEATGDFGWIYQPATKTIRLDRTGTDKDGIRYYDY